MIGRIGDDVYAPQLVRCEGCAQNTLECEARMDDGARCCGCCTHVHSMHTLALYGLLES